MKRRKAGFKKIMAHLKKGLLVTFHSDEPNEARRSMNGRKCRVFEWVTNPTAGYPHNIAIGLQFEDDQRKTYATVYEFRIRYHTPRK